MNQHYDKLWVLIVVLFVIGLFVYRWFRNPAERRNRILSEPFPYTWRNILVNHVRFYSGLEPMQKAGFEKRIQLFLGNKKIIAIDTDLDDTVRILVAASAIIPMFAFPEFNYPNLKEVLIYPNSFDEKFQTSRYTGHQQNITGMVGDRFMNGTMIISKPDLLDAYDGIQHKGNVGIHEFVHLVDKADGSTDGIPELLLQHSYVIPWLHLIKDEMRRIEAGHSDINPYALTNDAEFLAVVSEYFFDNPEKFKQKHPELYKYLVKIFHQHPEGS